MGQLRPRARNRRSREFPRNSGAPRAAVGVCRPPVQDQRELNGAEPRRCRGSWPSIRIFPARSSYPGPGRNCAAHAIAQCSWSHIKTPELNKTADRIVLSARDLCAAGRVVLVAQCCQHRRALAERTGPKGPDGKHGPKGRPGSVVNCLGSGAMRPASGLYCPPPRRRALCKTLLSRG